MVTVKMFFLFFCTIVLISSDSPLAHIMMLPIDYDSTYTRKFCLSAFTLVVVHSYITIFGIVVKVSLHVHASVVLYCTLLFSTILTSLWGSHFFLMLFVDSRNNYRCLIHLFILFLFSFVLQSRLQSSTWNHSCHCFWQFFLKHIVYISPSEGYITLWVVK